MRRATISLLLALLPTAAASAQQVRGVVRDSVSGVPIVAAVVTTEGSTPAVRTLTDGDGRFTLDLPTTVTRLRVLRIGFSPRVVEVPGDAQARGALVVRMLRLPAMLTSIRVSDRAECPGSDDRSGALGLWEQARAALLATVVIRQVRPATMHILSYVTDEEPEGRLVTHQVVSARVGLSSRPFVAVNAASGFAEQGYMRHEGADLVFMAPDADVLLDEAFAASHCFRAVRDARSHPGQVGLAFDPSPRERPPGFVDVRGTLWMTENPAALLSMDFRYTGLDRALQDAGAGGSLSFRDAPNGLTYLNRWNMLLPAVEVTVPDTTTMSRIGVPRPRSSRVVQFRETGGLVESASWPDGTRVSEPLGTVTGVVADDDGHHPMSGVSVGLLGTALATTTDSSGAYTLGPVLPGRYTLVAADSTRVPVDDRAQARRTIDVGNDTLRVTPMVLRARQPLLRNPL